MKTKHYVRLTALLTTAVVLTALLGCKSQVSGDVMATVDGRKIFRSDIDKYYDNQVASAQQAPAGEQATILRLNILRQLIDDEMVMRRAEKLGLLATEEEVDRKLNEIKSPYTQQEFDKRLQEKKITLEDFKRDIRRSITVDKVMNKEVSSKINVTDQDITDYFTAHKSEFNLIEPQYHLAQVFVTPAPNPQVHNQNNKAQNEGDARKKIQMIANRLDSGDERRRSWNNSRIFAAQHRSGHARLGAQTEARAIQPDHYGDEPRDQAGGRIPHRETGFQRACGAARFVRPARAASHPFAASRPARTVAQGRLLRNAARLRQGGELLRQESAG